jgi:hypothetical protein
MHLNTEVAAAVSSTLFGGFAIVASNREAVGGGSNTNLLD